jgi:tetratricopeptide (TPR) repeat protein
MLLLHPFRKPEFQDRPTVDWLDKVSIVAVAGLIVAAGGMLGNQQINKRHSDNRGEIDGGKGISYASQVEVDRQMYSAVTAYQDKGLHDEAIAELDRIAKNYPGNSLSYMYLAESYLAQGRLADAIRNYRRAVEMEPDYVDKRTTLFRGEELKDVVTEGILKLEREKKLKPKDDEVKQALKDVYYLQRRLAGGCE